MEYPARGYHVPHPHDVSLQTYRGHCVSQTLIRAYFSPAATTAQRYVYAGSADGAVRIWGAPPVEFVIAPCLTCMSGMLWQLLVRCSAAGPVQVKPCE